MHAGMGPSAHSIGGAWARALDSNRLAWTLVALCSGATFVGILGAGRPPGVDLPQHALYLERMLEGSNDVHQVRWSVPYTLLFALAAPISSLTGPVRAIWVATVFALALVPVSSAALAAALRRSPALGLFAFLGVFGSATAWGFASFMLGVGVLGFTLAAALRYARRPSATRGSLLCALLVASYCAHFMTWTIALAGCLGIVLVWPRRASLVTTWPVILGMLITVVLLRVATWDMTHPWAKGLQAALFGGEDHTLMQRITAMPRAVVEYGRPGALIGPWLALAALFSIGAASSLREHLRVLARARIRVRESSPTLAALARRYGAPLAFIATLVAYFVVPLWVGETAMVYPRFLPLACLLAPAAFLSRPRRGPSWAALTASVPALLLVVLAVAETRANALRTRCIDELAAHVRAGESLLSLYYGPTTPNRRMPRDLHTAAELAARFDAQIGEDLTDLGLGPVTYQPDRDRLVVPASMLHDPGLYRHALHGREFTAWLLVGATGDERAAMIAEFGGSSAVEVHTCESWTLAIDTRVPPGSHPHEVFLPHAHASGRCSVEAHAGRVGAPFEASP